MNSTALSACRACGHPFEKAQTTGQNPRETHANNLLNYTLAGCAIGLLIAMLLVIVAGMGVFSTGSNTVSVSIIVASIMTSAAVGALAGVLLYLFLIPTRVATSRSHPNREAVTVLTIIGLFIWPCWIIALVWSFTKPRTL